MDPELTRAAQAESWASVADALAGVPALVAVTQGPDHELAYTNDAYLEVFGRGAGTHPELSADRAIAVLDNVYRSGRPHSIRAVPVPLVATDGRTHDGYFTFVYLPLRDSDRRLSGVLVVAVDITAEIRSGRREGPLTLPSAPLRVPHQPDELHVAVRSRGGGSDGAAAWHDVVPLGAGRTAIVIGDVLSAGAETGAVLGQVRAALRAYARLDLPPVEVLGLLDELVADGAAGYRVTCGYAVFDPAENTLSYASAGQRPPLLLRPEGEPGVPLTELGAPLGSRGGSFAEAEWSLEEGAVLALYTAALVGDGAPDATDRLAAALGSETGSLDERCGIALDSVAAPTNGNGHAVGEAMLVVIGRRDPGGGRLPRSIELELREGREPARRARAFCHGVLSTWQVPDHKREDIVLVVSELVTNAILHGGAAEQLRLRRTARRVVIEVFDNGPRMPHPRAADLKAESGRGLHLVARLADRWGARPVRGGKAVWCEFDAPVPELAGRRGGGEPQALSG